MKVTVIAVGTKMPDWVEKGYAEYVKRLPRDFSLNLTEIAMINRGKTQLQISRPVAVVVTKHQEERI